jgi:Trypsin-like peptidase domain
VPKVMTDYVENLAFLYLTRDAAQCNMDAGGSGFLLGVGYKEQPELAHVYVVTNSHVISACKIVRFTSRRVQPNILDLSESRWIKAARDDVAVCSLGRSASFSEAPMVRASSLLTEDELEDDTATYRSDHPSYGDEVFMASRLINKRLKGGSVPAVRFGTLVSGRPEAVTRKGFDQVSFLVEMRSISGHSGSPVFLYYNDATLHMQQGLPSSAIRLLGIDWGHLSHKTGNPADTAAWNAGIACVVPAWKITELLEDEELVRERQDVEQELAKNAEPADPMTQ